MKLLLCNVCYDILALNTKRWRTCDCGSCGGQYNYDNVTATIGGQCRILGIANPFLSPEWQEWSEEERTEYRKKHYPEGKGQDIWFGEYAGDVQLFRIEDPQGPRLKTEGYLREERNQIEIVVTDTRTYVVGLYQNQRSVFIPNYGDGIRLGYEGNEFKRSFGSWWYRLSGRK